MFPELKINLTGLNKKELTLLLESITQAIRHVCADQAPKEQKEKTLNVLMDLFTQVQKEEAETMSEAEMKAEEFERLGEYYSGGKNNLPH